MISSVTFHPFISHFPIALLLAGFWLLVTAYLKKDDQKKAAASFNLSIGFLMSVLAALTGMVSTDIELRTAEEVAGHQGYSFLLVIGYGFCAGYVYIKAFSSAALLSYGMTLLAMCASAWTGYALVFHPGG
ncbi:MAG: DUF2231 domain-containing protein [Nitrospinota bacterium]|nr:DUF2231 domain-containing protein [Nitrospinota bacterium]